MSTLWRTLFAAWLGASMPMPADDASVLGLDPTTEVHQSEQQSADAIAGALSGSQSLTADSPTIQTPHDRPARTA
ncbi:MAG TPA: hypothetical protein VMB81_04985 [Candidatus Sulfotelmatobacter sp.]|nr:hypothetical protein [Candidatus Sulfotelmatobacter sp.]